MDERKVRWNYKVTIDVREIAPLFITYGGFLQGIRQRQTYLIP